MKTVLINGRVITDEGVLHDEFAAEMGFPGFYGQNWDAWIDCMSYITEPEAEMTKVHVAVGEELQVCVSDGRELERLCPDLVKNLLECTEFVNERFKRRGEDTRIRVSLDAAQQGVAPDGRSPLAPARRLTPNR
jgi:RNAse (barnase) inhibitor barstar